MKEVESKEANEVSGGSITPPNSTMPIPGQVGYPAPMPAGDYVGPSPLPTVPVFDRTL
jgi:hypothetical protein